MDSDRRWPFTAAMIRPPIAATARSANHQRPSPGLNGKTSARRRRCLSTSLPNVSGFQEKVMWPSKTVSITFSIPARSVLD